ncbi:hypothetical protein CON65_02595 [Bacillus pseudomycoides]|uniref:Phr family secreted Rap phosphatase inhibitor n=1 Tax=Bacillus pseudomycoides TaxID=64104 RepID=A0AA91ZV37_9BACI|nr:MULTISPECIES: hypothetical protein [Bacillus]PED84340.1 hypothetical protein CON65_02595 [Bacillus pseudomycoides]PEU08671.1 hypothetical protein CN525_25655 [Bacillus sp. AFS014408]PEU15867.1 hypothetical protein CN524_06300 [Bacillus sp. AFS019443]PFW64833.1 hypothetical protein COL20_02260 [Bacillus sp. AFS075034]
MKKIVSGLIIACTLALTLIPVSNNDNSALQKQEETKVLKMKDPGTLG